MQIFLSDIAEANFSRTDGAKDKQPRKIRRAGRDFVPNKVYPSTKAGKKNMVLVRGKADGKTKLKLLHFGDKSASDYTIHKNNQRRKNYLTRSAGIRDKNGNLTKDNKFSANYWSRKINW